MLSEGDRAPAFTLPDQDGNKVKLTDLKGEKVVVYFYPRADTSDGKRSSLTRCAAP